MGCPRSVEACAGVIDREDISSGNPLVRDRYGSFSIKVSS